MFAAVLMASLTTLAAEPQTVTVGIYVNQTTAVNLHDNQITADFNLWFRWKGDGLDPLDSFELTHGKVDQRDKDRREKAD